MGRREKGSKNPNVCGPHMGMPPKEESLLLSCPYMYTLLPNSSYSLFPFPMVSYILTPQICHVRKRRGRTIEIRIELVSHSHQCQILAVSLKISAFVHRRNDSSPLEELSEALNIRVDRPSLWQLSRMGRLLLNGSYTK